VRRPSIDTILEPLPTHRKARLRSAEVATLVFLAFLAIVAWSHPAAVPLSTRTSLLALGFLFTVAALALNGAVGGWRYWTRELLLLPVVPYMFLNLGALIPLVNPFTHDDMLVDWDRRLLGPETQAALYNLPLPWWLSDLLTAAYSTFFFAPIVLVVTLGRRRDPLLPRVTAAVLYTFLVSYAGYFVVPAYGPRTTVAQERYATLPAGVVGAPLRDLLDHWERTKTDAFPSGHTMVTVAILFCARRRYRALYNAMLPVGALLIAATILLTYHYVVDVIAAVPLVVASVLLARFLAGRVSPHPPGEPAAKGS